MNEVERMRARYAQQIEDGKKIEAFTSMPEWNWYVSKVIKPTIEEYTEKILSGKIPSNKEDWITRGMIQGMRLMIETPEIFKEEAKTAKDKAKDIEAYLNATE